MPWWVQLLVTILVPVEGLIIGYLITRGKERKEQREKEIETTADAQAQQHIADLDAEAKFTAMLLGRITHLENQDLERQRQSENRAQQMHVLELANQKLSMQLDAMKLELAGKINAAVSTVEKAAATVLSEAQKKGTE